MSDVTMNVTVMGEMIRQFIQCERESISKLDNTSFVSAPCSLAASIDNNISARNERRNNYLVNVRACVSMCVRVCALFNVIQFVLTVTLFGFSFLLFLPTNKERTEIISRN